MSKQASKIKRNLRNVIHILSSKYFCWWYSRSKGPKLNIQYRYILLRLNVQGKKMKALKYS